MLVTLNAAADETLRDRIHREYKHRSYMLVEDDRGARLFLFDTGSDEVHRLDIPTEPFVAEALAMTRSVDPRQRVRGLVELAGAEDRAALDVALTLLDDPSPAVRDEARSLILDHPDAAVIAEGIGLPASELEEPED